MIHKVGGGTGDSVDDGFKPLYFRITLSNLTWYTIDDKGDLYE